MSKKNKVLLKEATQLFATPEKKELEFKDCTIKYKYFLSIKERNEFINEIISWCVFDGIYNPLFFDIGLRCATLQYYTNITIPKGEKEAMNLLVGSGLYEEIIKHINTADYSALVEGAKEILVRDYTRKPFDNIIEYFEDILGKYNAELESIDLDKFKEMLEIVTQANEKKEFVNLFKSMYKTEE